MPKTSKQANESATDKLDSSEETNEKAYYINQPSKARKQIKKKKKKKNALPTIFQNKQLFHLPRFYLDYTLCQSFHLDSIWLNYAQL